MKKFTKKSFKIANQKKLENQMDSVHSSYHRACVVISGDSLEDWKYIFRELKTRVGVSFLPFEISI